MKQLLVQILVVVANIQMRTLKTEVEKGVANTLYGYAALPRTATDGTRDNAMSMVPLAELEEAIERVAPDMNSQGVANTVWAYGTLGVPPTRGILDKLEAALRHMVRGMNPQEF